ncbi:Myb-like DNA-binding domain containing protein [Tritrichomonas foetus]|uniref:Myb-like DNA-binding domain containing protein n=1 Tax=Tritrichomonas foetus TaxID=1144522 RepID=A0A1J4K5G3_9EUKA|nr:Myb-like DNA-binding domain containing protein [Tritrichomonas foetus]|eukprot:OHT06112.1 Myb-like DNA-binding domain containing protein [Tritrichomonas foetus]
MDDPNLPEEQAPGQPTDLSQAALQASNAALTHDLLSLILQMQNGAIDSKSSDLINRGSWSQQEDDQLTSAVQQLGAKKWTDIAKFVPSRTSKQCRERWFNRLSPDLKHEPFDPAEDQIIIQKQKEIGNRWAIIARQLPGRSPNSIKNRWYSGLKAQHEPCAQISITSMSGDLIQVNPPLPTDIMTTGPDLTMGGVSDHDGISLNNQSNTDL